MHKACINFGSQESRLNGNVFCFKPDYNEKEFSFQRQIYFCKFLACMLKYKEIEMSKCTFLNQTEGKRVPLSYLTIWLLIQIAKCLICILNQKYVFSKKPPDPLLLVLRGSRAAGEGGAITSFKEELSVALFTWVARPFTKFPQRKQEWGWRETW